MAPGPDGFVPIPLLLQLCTRVVLLLLLRRTLYRGSCTHRMVL